MRIPAFLHSSPSIYPPYEPHRPSDEANAKAAPQLSLAGKHPTLMDKRSS